MKRKSTRCIALILGLFMVVSIAACAPVSAPETPVETPEEMPVKTPQTIPDYIPTEEDLYGDAPADVPPEGAGEIDGAAVEALNAMHPVYDSFARAMADIDTRYADAHDPVFFWTVLYYLSTNYAELHPLTEKEDMQYIIPGAAMREFADACFFGYGEIPELPRQAFGITYDGGADSYTVGMSDSGDTYVQEITYRINGAGSMEAVAAMCAVGEADYDAVNAVFYLELVPNENAGEGEALFQYSVTSARVGYTDLARVKAIYEKDGKQYATLGILEKWPGDGMVGILGVQDNGAQTEAAAPAETEVDLLIGDEATFTFSGIMRLIPDADSAAAEADSRTFFIQNAAREAEGEQLKFYVNILDDVLHGGALYTD